MTLCDLATNATLGDIIVFRGGKPAATYVGSHVSNEVGLLPSSLAPLSPTYLPQSYSGSVFTEVRLDRWGPRDCTVVLQTTVVGNADLQYLATSNGTSCSGLALLVTPTMLWQRAGVITAVTPNVTTAQVYGFADTFTVHAVGAAPVPFSNGGPASWALPLAPPGATAGVVGYSTGAAPLSVADMQASAAVNPCAVAVYSHFTIPFDCRLLSRQLAPSRQLPSSSGALISRASMSRKVSRVAGN